jgi:transposase
MEYEWIPGQLVRRVHIVEAARCPCKLHYVRGPAPVRVQAGCTYGPGFIAKLVVDRCADSVPLYRVEKAMDRAGIPIARSTMGDLVHLAGELCEPLYDVLLAELREDPHVQADETTIRLQTSTQKAWVWTFLSELYTAYVFSTSRSGDTPKEVLGGTTGSLTVDGYTGYNVVTAIDGRERSGCWSHARRTLFEAMPNAPHARRGLDIILDLFQVERTALNRDQVGKPEHHLLRQRRSVPILEELRLWRLATEPLYEPKSTMGKALGYLENQWVPLSAFVGDPKIPIHNNASEAALRIIALIRKNSMFFGNDDAARRFMILHTLVATCDKHAVNPVEYLTDVLIRIQDYPAASVADLLPHRWKLTFANATTAPAPEQTADDA